MSEEQTFWVTNIFGAKTREGLVELRTPGLSEPIHMRPWEARRIAKHLLEAAEAADREHFLVDWLQQRGRSYEQAIRALRDFRDWRTKHASREIGPEGENPEAEE